MGARLNGNSSTVTAGTVTLRAVYNPTASSSRRPRGVRLHPVGRSVGAMRRLPPHVDIIGCFQTEHVGHPLLSLFQLQRLEVSLQPGQVVGREEDVVEAEPGGPEPAPEGGVAAHPG